MQEKQYNTIDDLPEKFFGAEGDEGDSSANSGDDAGAGAGDAGSASEGSEEQTHDDTDKSDTTALKNALAAERKAAKSATAELKKLQKEKADRELSEKSEVEQAQAKADAASEKVTRLAQGLLNRDLNAAITAAAKDFIDPEDAIAGVDRSKLVFTQDEDDPTDITIDEKSVMNVVKALAAKKPHFLKTGTSDGDATGSQFGTKGNKNKGGDDQLKELYPALQG